MHPLMPELLKNVAIGITIPAIAVWAGHWFDRQEDLRMTKFRDRSALYGRELKPGEKPSWP